MQLRCLACGQLHDDLFIVCEQCLERAEAIIPAVNRMIEGGMMVNPDDYSVIMGLPTKNEDGELEGRPLPFFILNGKKTRINVPLSFFTSWVSPG